MAKMRFSIEFEDTPVESTECYFCTEDTWGINEGEDPDNGMPAGDRDVFGAICVVSGMPLCRFHTYQELAEILENPGTFLSSSMEWDDVKDAVPYYVELRRLVEPVS